MKKRKFVGGMFAAVLGIAAIMVMLTIVRERRFVSQGLEGLRDTGGPVGRNFIMQRDSLSTAAARRLRFREPRAELGLLQSFLARMDSLRADSGSRASYDSFMLVHPGLIDSALDAVRYYLSR